MQTVPANTIPDSGCPICLDTFDNAVYLDPCCHVFCFHCIQEWSKFKTECPLCEQPFSCLHHTDHAENGPSENRYFINSDQSTTSSAESPFDLQAWDQHVNYGYSMPLHNEGNSSASTIPSVFSDEANPQELEHGSSEQCVDPFPQNDETPGPLYSHSEKHGTTIISSSELETSSENAGWESATMQFLLQFIVNSSNFLSEHRDIAGYVNLSAEGTPELSELSSDSEDSIREEKREDVKKEQSAQDSSGSDRELCMASSPHSPLCEDCVSSCQSSLHSVIKRTESMDEQKNKDVKKDHSPHDSDWSLSPRMDNVYSPHSQRLSRKRKTRSPQNSEHQFKKRLSKSGDGSKHWSKRSRRSRPCDMSPSLKGQTESSNCESTSSSDSSRPWSYHKGHGQRRSSSLDSDCSYGRACYQSSCLSCSPRTVGDGSPCSESTQSETHCSSKSPGPEFGIQSFTERTDLQSQMGFHERHDSCYEQCRSRSSPSSRSRSPSGETDRTRSKNPGGKRKFKARHLENAEKGSTSMERKYSLERVIPTSSDCYKNKGSLSDNQESSETKYEEKYGKTKCGESL